MNNLRQNDTAVSRSGRIIKKSAKKIESEESFLTDEYLMHISRKKPRCIDEDTVHCLDVMNNKLAEGTKVLDFKLCPDSTNSISLSSTSKDRMSKSLLETINGFKMSDLVEENRVFHSKCLPGSSSSTCLSSADFNHLGLNEENKHRPGSNHSLSSINLFNHLDVMTNEKKVFYSNHNLRLKSSLFSIHEDESPKPFNRAFQRPNNSLSYESDAFYSKRLRRPIHSTSLSLEDAAEIATEKNIQCIDLTHDDLEEESKVLYWERHRADLISLSSSDDEEILETGSENSRRATSTSSSSEQSQGKDQLDDENSTDHKYCTRNVAIQNHEAVFENGALTRRSKNVDAYTLWSSLNRKIISASNVNLPRREISKKVVEEWNALPSKEKSFWAKKVRELSQRIRNCSFSSHSNTDAVPVCKNSDCDVGWKQSTQTIEIVTRYGPPKKRRHVEEHVLGIAAVDTAAHLKLLGDNLIKIGQRIFQADIEPSSAGAYCVLLDSLLCSMGALLCLSRKIPGLEQLPTASFEKTLDHIAYFMPGL